MKWKKLSYDLTLSPQKKVCSTKILWGNQKGDLKMLVMFVYRFCAAKKMKHSSFVAKINPHFFAVAFNTTSTFFSSIVQRPCLKTDRKEAVSLQPSICRLSHRDPHPTSCVVSYWTAYRPSCCCHSCVAEQSETFPPRNRTCIHFGVLHFPKTGLFHRFARPCLFYFAWLIFRCAVLFPCFGVFGVGKHFSSNKNEAHSRKAIGGAI